MCISTLFRENVVEYQLGTDAERKDLVLGEGLRVKIEKDEEEISRLVREEIVKEVEGQVESGKLRWDEEGRDLWLRLPGLKL